MELRLIHLGLLVSAAAIGCATTSSAEQVTTVPPVASSTDKVEQVNGANSVVFEKHNGVLTYKSPFDAPTSVKLTAIVGRAKASIDRFDKISPTARQTVESAVGQSKNSKQMVAAKAAIDQIKQLQGPVEIAKAEMIVAKAELITSKRYYSAPVLAGMETFIAAVDSELTDEVAGLTAKLAKKN